MQRNRKNTTHNEENHQSMKTDPEITQIIELVDKDIKIAILSCICSRNRGKEYVWQI